VLGLKLQSKRPHCAIVDTGNGIIEVFCDADKLLGQGDIRHIALATDNVDKCVQAVESAGYEIKRYPIDIILDLGKPTPARIAFCCGVLGEEIEFFQVREEC
jgi:glyoxylase I family protein